MLAFSCTQLYANDLLPSDSSELFFTESELEHANKQNPPCAKLTLTFGKQLFEIEEKIYEGKTPFQTVLIFKHAEFGRVLVLDNIVQTSEADECIYHEMLCQVPLLAHPNPKKVLIIGGGDGGSLREVLRHKSVVKVTLVELDEEVLFLCRKYLPTISNGAFDDSRLELMIQDGVEFVNNCKSKFDVIICDTTDPSGPNKGLCSTEFYMNCQKLLNENGIVATYTGIPFLGAPFSDGQIITDSFHALSPNFKNARMYVASVPTYIGGFMAFALATNNPANLNRSTKELQARLKTLGGTMRYYTPELHNAAFALPQYILDRIPAKK
ncbi:MAG TPA: polyamine aminopropyltransferase [Chlamydiales bacterium]|nr:polyamine aminopropyltransferase [Chlamydiales bacterium]